MDTQNNEMNLRRQIAAMSDRKNAVCFCLWNRNL